MKTTIITTAALLAALSAAAFETPTMGWSSWNTYRVNISEEIICKQADAMAQNGLKEAGYTYINIDDGFFGGRDAEGNLLFHATRFPNGLKPVVDHIHSLGFKAGIYSDAGHNTCGNFWDNDGAGVGVGFYDHDDADARLYFNDLGFDFIKIDFCGGDAAQNHEGLHLDEKTRYSAIRKAIDGVGREDVRVNVCRWAFPGTWVHTIGSSWRISADITANWGSVKRIINANRYLSAYAGEGHFNDMDMLEIGRGLSEAEERTHFGMWCIMSSPLLIGCDLTKIPAKSLALISNPELIAINQDSLGLQAYKAGEQNGVELYVKDIETLHGTTRAVALYNPTDADATFTLDPAQIDLGGDISVRNLFAGKDLGNRLTFNVGAHDTQILRIEGTERMERKLYEAETAWLERFQDLGINPAMGHATYQNLDGCSGGAKVGWLGNHPDNYMEYRDVWSKDGGDYILTIDYVQWDDRTINLSINGGEAHTINLPATEARSNKVRSESVKVTLAPGSNTLRISNPTAWAPDIDCIRIEKAGPFDGIENIKVAKSSREIKKIAVGKDGQLEGEVWDINGRPRISDSTLSRGIYLQRN